MTASKEKSQTPNSPCQGCTSSQQFSFNVHPKRVRRSNSYPFDSSGNFHSLKEKERTRSPSTGGIIKRWHSIPAVYLVTNDYSSSISSTNQQGVTNTRSHLSGNKGVPSRIPPLAQRITFLFAFGSILALLLNFLQKQKGVTVFSPGIFGDVLNSAWWIPPTFGLGAIVVGLVYPKLDELFGNEKALNYEWSSVMRCIAAFVGINHASARIDFDSNVHLSLTLAILSIGLWYFFDQSIAGLGLGLLTTSIATVVTQVLVAMDVFGYTNPDFLYMQSWVPWLYFSGGVTIGTFGRALAKFESSERIHYHMD